MFMPKGLKLSKEVICIEESILSCEAAFSIKCQKGKWRFFFNSKLILLRRKARKYKTRDMFGIVYLNVRPISLEFIVGASNLF